MPTISVPEETYAKLVRHAAAMGATVEAIALPALEMLVANDNSPAADLSYDEWKKGFDELLSAARNRADCYPPGFQADVSRESIYEGCGE